MNFFNWFKKKKYDIGIIRYGDSIVIPGREYFDNEDDIKILEECKQHYLSKLYQRKAITTLDFNSNELKEDMKRNVDLIVHLLLDNENFYLLSPEELLIQSGKLRIYYEEIARLEKLTITRLVALKEIEKSEQVPRHNRMALEEEINQLSTILQMYSYQKPAIAMELKNYFDVLSTRDLKDAEAEKIILQERLNRLLFITDGIVDTSIIEGDLDIKSKIVLLEILCEKYAYQNKKKVEEIRGKYVFVPTYSDYSALFSLSSEIEQKYLLFNEYGNKAITDEEVKNMYKLKYKQVLDTMLDTDGEYNFDEDYGYVYYKAHLEESIDCILRGKCESFNNDFEDLREATSIFRDYLQDADKMIDVEKILKDRNKLKLVYTYENGMGLHTYLDKAKLQDFNDLYKESGIIFSHDAKMIEVLKYVSSVNPIYKHPIYKLFLLIEESRREFNFSSCVYPLPDGLEEIDFIMIDNTLQKKIFNFCNGRFVSCPDSLIKLCYGNLFENTDIRELSVGANLETCVCNIFHAGHGGTLISYGDRVIHSPVSISSDDIILTYEQSGFEHKEISKNIRGCLHFRDYKSSKLLSNKEEVRRLFDIYCYKNDWNKPEYAIAYTSRFFILKLTDPTNGNSIIQFTNQELYDMKDGYKLSEEDFNLRDEQVEKIGTDNIYNNLLNLILTFEKRKATTLEENKAKILSKSLNDIRSTFT